MIYCFGWSQLIGKTILSIPQKGIVGFHPAELPSNRGRHPIIWALALGLSSTASTFFFITEGADNGDIISQVKIPIEYEDDANTLYNKIMQEAVIQIKSFTEEFCSDSIVKIVQDDSKANYWRKRSIKDGEIDWRMSSKSIYNLVRALTKPYVGAHFIYKDNIYKIWKATVISDKKLYNIEYGKVLKVYSNTSFEVKTGDGVLFVNQSDAVVLTEGEYLI